MMTGVYALWKREMIRYFREKSRLLTSVFTPLLWIFVFGTSLGRNITFETTLSYQEFVYPGIIGMTILFGSIFYGTSLIWDRQFGFLKEILVSPVSRLSIFLGKVLGGVTIALIQGIIVLLSGYFLGIQLTITSILLALLIMALISTIIVSAGLIIGSKMESFDSFNMVMSFLVLPMFLFSGALYPISNLPVWVTPILLIDPLTYGVDALRGVLVGEFAFSLATDLIVLFVFAAVLIAIGQQMFKNLK